MSKAPETNVASSETEVQAALDKLTKLLIALAGLNTALAAFRDNLSSWLPWVEQIPKPYFLLCAVVLFGLSAALQRRRLQRRSRLRKPEALVLRVGEHLVGREEDIENFIHHVDNSSMIWLVGESGAGKSSLLRGGILPLLRRDATKLPFMLTTGAMIGLPAQDTPSSTPLTKRAERPLDRSMHSSMTSLAHSRS